MKHIKIFHLCFVMLFLTALSTASYAAEADAREEPSVATTKTSKAERQKLLVAASEHVKNGRMNEAYTLLAPYQSELAGNPEYDYLLGLSAIDIGKVNEAIFALERVLAVQPNHLQARAEIARAYLAAGEISASKQEFEAVQKQKPPKEVSATIQKYLDIIETGIKGQKSSLQAYVEVVFGSDSNVNTATSNRQIAIPFFGGAVLNLSADGVAKSDTFGTLATGFNMRREFAPDWAFVGGANINTRNNSTYSAFNTSNGDLNAGVSLNSGNNNYLAVLQYQSFILNNTGYRDAAGITGQWQRNLNSGNQLSSYLQYSSLTYPTQTYRNADRYVLGGAYAMPLSGESAPVVFAGAYAGAEQLLKSGYSNLANSFYGGRVGGEMKYTPRITLLASASMEFRSHEGKDTLFLVKRNDTQTDMKLGFNYLPTKAWTINTSVAYTTNDSNIIINKYDRTVLSLSARRDFN
jgi:tetratricopeptide (TPR) repeat protein